MKTLSEFKKLCQIPGTTFVREFPIDRHIAPAVREVQRGQTNGVWFVNPSPEGGPPSWFEFPKAANCKFTEEGAMVVMNKFDGKPQITFKLGKAAA